MQLCVMLALIMPTWVILRTVWLSPSSPMPVAHHRLPWRSLWHFGFVVKRRQIFFFSPRERASVSVFPTDNKRKKQKCVCNCEQHTDLLTLWDKGCQQQHFNLIIV